MSLLCAALASTTLMFAAGPDCGASCGSPACRDGARVWVSRAIVGPEARVCRDGREPGPAYYGAGPCDDARVAVRIGNTVTVVSAWQRIDGTGNLRTLERARRGWLRDHGYTGSVRTFRNPIYRTCGGACEAPPPADDEEAAAPGAREIKPRAILKLREDIPRRRPRLEVRGEPVRFMMPDSTSVALAEEAAALETTELAAAE